MLKEMEAENESLVDEKGQKSVRRPLASCPLPVTWLSPRSLCCHSKGDASAAARRAKAELEVKCRELEDQVRGAKDPRPFRTASPATLR